MEPSQQIIFTESPKNALNGALKKFSPDQVAILVDENTAQHCLPLFDLNDADFRVIQIRSGEKNKNIDTCLDIWKSLTEWGFSRKSLLVNLGGGVIGDMGGFAASTYKRGIKFINFPTTLLAMVDANIGGKLGIDFMGFKNHIGLFNDPECIYIHTEFLRTLPERELRSGFAEVIKHGLIQDKAYWKQISSSAFPDLDWKPVVQRSYEIKQEVVSKDPKEEGLRKILNFGHTLGHAIESWYLNHGKSLLHGEAIAVGMILEADLSKQLNLLENTELGAIRNFINKTYEKIRIPPLSELQRIMGQDKKNKGNSIMFSLIKGIGDCVYDQNVEDELISTAIKNYDSLK